MEVKVKTFEELTTRELFEIYKLRSCVFVVEQKCPFQDVDDIDLCSLHVWLEEDGKIMAYARVIPAGLLYAEPAIGRAVAVERRKGYGTCLIRESIRTARERFKATSIRIEAQVYVKELYRRLGFHEVSKEYLLDNIPHVEMLLGEA